MHPIRPGLAAVPQNPPLSAAPAAPIASPPSRPLTPPPGSAPGSPFGRIPPGSPPPEFFHDGFLHDLAPFPGQALITPPSSPPLTPMVSPPVSPPSGFLAPGFSDGLDALPGRRPRTPPTSPELWFRPESPTYRVLQDNADMELLLGASGGPMRPAGVRPMNGEQSEAASHFRAGIAARDPEGTLRHAGEFGQTFHREGGRLVPSIPLQFQPGTAIAFPPGAVDGRTVQVLHSHPGGADYHPPSDADYLAAYFSSRGNSGALRDEMVYHPGTDRFYAYEPRLDSGTNRPRYFKLSETAAPPPAKRARLDGDRA